MARFDAATAVEAMDYDFTKFGGSRGTIPEPSNKQVEAFFNRVGKMARDLGFGKDTNDPAVRAELEEFLAGLDDEQVEAMKAELPQAISDVCSGTPSAEEYNLLPYRVQGAFSAWLAAQLRPEAQGSATKR